MTHVPNFADFVNTISQSRNNFEQQSKVKDKLRGVDWRKNDF